MLIYVVKSNDTRYWHLYCLLKEKDECEYSNTIPLKNNVKVLILPLDGIDEFGYIKHTSMSLEKMLLINKIEVIYTGKVNKYLKRICQQYGIKIYSFYDDANYLNNEQLLKMEVIKYFLEEKFNCRFDELKILILKDNLLLPLKVKLENNNDVDVIVNYSSVNLDFFKDKIIIEMKDINDIDLTILLNCKKVYLINQLLSQYLTKSGAKILYDSMVNR